MTWPSEETAHNVISEIVVNRYCEEEEKAMDNGHWRDGDCNFNGLIGRTNSKSKAIQFPWDLFISVSSGAYVLHGFHINIHIQEEMNLPRALNGELPSNQPS